MISVIPMLAVAMGMTILVAVSALYLRGSNQKVQLARLKMVATSHFLGNTAALRPFQQKPIADPMLPGDYIDALYEPDNVKEHIFWPSVLCIATVFSMAFTLFIAFQWGYFQEPSMILGGAFLVGAEGLKCPDSCRPDVQKIINDYQLGSLLVIEVAFLSAYIWALWQLFQRMVTRDVTVYAFHAITIRVVTAAILSLIFFHGLSPAIGDVAALKTPAGTAAGSPLSHPDTSFNYYILLAFAIGFFPETALTWLGALARKLIFNMGPSSSYLDIEEIEGIDSYTRARLSELGIQDAPRLATCNPMTLALRTPYSLQQIMDWIGQAQLLLLLKKETFNTLRVQGIRTSFQFYELLATAPVPKILEDVDNSYCRLMLDKDPAFVRAKEVAERMLIQPDYATGEEQKPPAAAQNAAQKAA
jgi:hypothetical protein